MHIMFRFLDPIIRPSTCLASLNCLVFSLIIFISNPTLYAPIFFCYKTFLPILGFLSPKRFSFQDYLVGLNSEFWFLNKWTNLEVLKKIFYVSLMDNSVVQLCLFCFILFQSTLYCHSLPYWKYSVLYFIFIILQIIMDMIF